jgi:circadian clock protein KaiC
MHIERREIEETGEYDLEGLFIRLGDAIDSLGARRVAPDTIETLFGGCPTRRSCARSCGGCSADSRTGG